MSEIGTLVSVIGGAGYTGAWLCRQLLAEGYRVRVFDNFMFGTEGLRGLDSPHLSVIEGSMCDIDAVCEAMKGADVVILLAGIVGHRLSDIRWTDQRNVNLFASSIVLDSAIEHGVTRFIFASTSSVYGEQSGLMYETSIPEPVSLYCRLKLRMEERVLSAQKRSFHPTVLRLANCHGYSPRMRFDLVANALMRDAAINKAIAIPSGEQSRVLIHVEDAARSFIACLKAHENLVSGEVFNVGAPDQNIQLNQLANLVKSLVPETTINIEERESESGGYRLSCSKIEKVLDFSPRWTLEASLSQLRDLLLAGHFPDPFSLRYHNS